MRHARVNAQNAAEGAAQGAAFKAIAERYTDMEAEGFAAWSLTMFYILAVSGPDVLMQMVAMADKAAVDVSTSERS